MASQELPSGTVTFLFTDLEDSTQLWEDYHQAMKSALARHDAILQAAVKAENGLIIKTTGDGLHAVFPTATDGVEAVLSAQLGLRAEAWDETGPLRVRMALHSGDAELRDGDYYGSVVNRAARIMGTASGEQILISGSTADLTRDHLPAGVALLDLGEHHLRGLHRPEKLYQVLHPDLPAEFLPLKTLGTVPNNLPAEITSFIGRENELAEVTRLLAPGESIHRLVTLTGPGGTGKTRLALEAAGDMLEDYPHGVWLAELAPVTNPQHVVRAVASPMGIRDQGARPLELMVLDHLRSQQALVILDNCEHLIDECARLAETLLRDCPQLHILASSREALGIAGERPFRVRSLSLPPETDSKSIAELHQYEAVRLFVERAAVVKPSFTLSTGNAQDISKICRRLDGIPLAIELAAARVRVLSPDQIVDRMDDRFRLLTGGSRTALPRQRTLQALIDWSYDLLPEAECTLLCRLSVFTGGWTLEAAESVAGFEPLDPYEVLDLLEQLVNKSLVVAESTELGMRYHMLESIRQYAQEKLADSGEGELVRERHLSYYLAQSQDAFRAFMDLQPPGDWGVRFKPEADNFRAAWARALEVGVGPALEFASSFSTAWSQVMPLVEVHRFQGSALALAEDTPEFVASNAPEENRLLLARALISAMAVASGARLLPQTWEYAKRSAALAEETGDKETWVWARSILLMSAVFTGGKEVLQKWVDEDYELVMQYGRDYHKAISLILWGTFRFFATGKYSQESLERWEEGMAMLRGGGNLWSQGSALQIAADLSKFRGEAEEARQLAEQVLEIYTELGDKYAANPARSLLADLARQEGDLEQAARLYRGTILVWRDTGRADSGVRTVESLAYIMHAEAQKYADIARQALLEYAITLVSAADAIRLSNGKPVTFLDKPEYEQELAELREEAGEDEFQSAWRKGQAMDLDQVILLATEEITLPSAS
jgi:predicted ATPase/class 3 adenylate cyclase